MRRKIGLFVMVLGFACLLSSFVYFMYLQLENLSAKNSSDNILDDLIDEINNFQDISIYKNPSSDGVSNHDFPNPYTPEMYVIHTSAGDLVGYITVPSLDLCLPIFSDCDYMKMTMAPCRYSGSIKTNDFVIAGHNYYSHFGRLDRLKIGDEVLFVDANNIRYRFSVKNIEIVLPTDTEKVTGGDYDLTLFTCTYSGERRITIFCDKI